MDELTVSIDAARRACGGADAIWWGMWHVRGKVYWFTVGPGSSLDAGECRLPSDELASLSRGQGVLGTDDLAVIEGYGRRERREQIDRIRSVRTMGGLLGTDGHQARALAELLPAELEDSVMPDDEARAMNGRLFLSLGQRLLPGPIRDALNGSSDVRLVVAPCPELAHVPFGLLGIEDAPGDPIRLLERATISYAPAAALAMYILRRQAREATDDVDFRHLLAVANPRDDLVYCAQAAPGAELTLGGHDAVGAGTVPAPASRANIVGLPAVRGLVTWLGHVTTGSHPLDSGLALAPPDPGGRADTLTARDLFTAYPNDLPTDWLIDGCLGNDLSHTEHLSLVPAVLWRGAERVTTTLWRIPDTPATQELHHRLAAELAMGHDPAVALRALQSAGLEAWRQGLPEAPISFAAHSTTGLTARGGANPVASRDGT